MFKSVRVTVSVTCLMAAAGAAVPAKDTRLSRKPEQSPIVLQDWKKLLSSIADSGTREIRFAEPPVNNPLYGRIVGTDGNPVVGARVLLAEAVRYPEFYRRNLDRTDEQGRFVVYGTPGTDLLYVQVDDHILRQQTNHNEDIVVRLPRLATVRFQTELWENQVSDRIKIVAFPASSNELTPFGSTALSLQELLRNGLQLFPGRYLVQGRRQFVLADVHGSVEILEFNVNRDQPEQSVLLDSRTGQKIIGKVKGIESRLAASKSVGIQVQLLSNTRPPRPLTSSVRVLDTAVCDFKGVFAFHNVPAGDYRLQGRFVPMPTEKRNNQFRQHVDTKVFDERVTIADSRVMLLLPRDNSPVPTAHKVHDILETEAIGSRNYTFSHDVAQLGRFWKIRDIEDRDGVVSELLRMLSSDDTPSTWRSRSIQLLGMLRPIEDRVVAGLFAALDRPANRYRGGSITGCLLLLTDEQKHLRKRVFALSSHSNWRVRSSLVDKLGRRASQQIAPDEAFAPLAVGLLTDPNGLIRKSAATWLGVLRVSSAVEHLTPMLKDSWGPARATAAWALWNITGSAEPSIDTMIDVLQKGDNEARREALYYIDSFDYFAEPALPALGYIVLESIAVGDALPNAQLRSRNAEAAKRAIKAIEASIAWHKQADRFEFQPKLLTDADEGSLEPAWGKVRNGLQLGLTPIADQEEFGIGDRIPIVLTLRNATEAPVEIETGGRLRLDGPQIVDAEENIRRTGRCHIRVGRDPIRFTLQPGQRLSIPMPGLGLGENPKPGAQLWHPYCATPPNGAVRLVQRFSVAVLDHANGTKKYTRLDSGEIKARLVSR